MCRNRYEVAKQYADVLRACATAGLLVEDWKNIQIYEDVMKLRKDGLKMEYCVNYVSDKYAISCAKVWRILRHLKAKA